MAHRPLHVDCRADAFRDSTQDGRETLVLQVDGERVRDVAADSRCYVAVDDYLHELLCCEGLSDLDVERVGVDFHAHVLHPRVLLLPTSCQWNVDDERALLKRAARDRPERRERVARVLERVVLHR